MRRFSRRNWKLIRLLDAKARLLTFPSFGITTPAVAAFRRARDEAAFVEQKAFYDAHCSISDCPVAVANILCVA